MEDKKLLKTGYYLSLYIAVNELSYVTNFALRGDQNISLWYVENNKVKLIHYWELERVTGLKGHERSFDTFEHAKEFINELLKEHELCLDDMVEVWGEPLFDTSSDYHSLDEYPELSYHSILHLFSALLLDSDVFFNQNILALAVDAGPDMVVDREKDSKPYYSGCYVEKGKVKDMFSICSPGPMWAASKHILGLREGSLMALETATKCQMNNAYFDQGLCDEMISVNKVKDDISDFNKLVNQKFADGEYHDFDYRFTEEENKISMFMKEIDRRSLEIIDDQIQKCIEKDNIDPSNTYFAITGGYGLNCPANSYFMDKYKFKGYVAPPCVNDGGLSLGIALYAFYKKMGHFDFKLNNAYWGDTDYVSKEELLEKFNKYIVNISEFTPKQVVEDIEKEPVVWFQGAAEIGPRALGHRSLIASATSVEAKDKLNEIKQRQWWRPVAPIILEDKVEEWFENAYATSYMLHTFTIKEDKKGFVPAIVHLNDSCRVQTLNREQNELLYDVICEVEKKSGVPIICNTSLNDRGEPIINTVDEVINFILHKKIKVAYINQYRVEFSNFELFTKEGVAERKLQRFFQFTKEDLEERMKVINPYGIPRDQLAVYLFSPKLYDRYRLDKKSDIRMIKMLTKIAENEHPTMNYGGINTGCS